jgi:hypothetical protein
MKLKACPHGEPGTNMNSRPCLNVRNIWGGPIVIVTTNGVFLPFLLAFFGFSFKFLIFVLFIDFHFGDDRYGKFSTIQHWRLWCKNLNQKKISWFQQ